MSDMTAYASPVEAAKGFDKLLKSLAPQIALLPDDQKPTAFHLVQSAGTDMRRAISVNDEERPKEVNKIRNSLTELERMLAGQRPLFALDSSAGRVASRHLRALSVSPQTAHTFEELYHLLDSLDKIIEDDSLRQLGIKPKPVSPDRAPTKKAPKTYAKAQDEVLSHLRQKGWAVVGHLKIPHATSPSGQYRYWFKAQAIYASHGASVKDFGSARSIFAGDYRFIDAKEFAEGLEKSAARG